MAQLAERALAPMAAERVAVVGAGWAGLAAALELVRAGCSVTLFETAHMAGGRARAVPWDTDSGDTLELDCGQHILIGAYRATLAQMKALGLEPSHLLQRLPFGITSTTGMCIRLPRLPAPFHLLVGLLSAKGLSIRDRLSMARLVARTKALGWRLPQDVTVCAWLIQQKQSERARASFWNPLCVAALNTPALTASAQVFINVLRDSVGGNREDSDFLFAAGALNTLFNDAAIASLHRNARVCLGTRALAIKELEGRICLEHTDGVETFDGAVCAAPAHQLERLLGSSTLPAVASLLRLAKSFTWQPITTVYLRFATRPVLTSVMTALNEDINAGRFGQWLFDREAMGGPRGLVSVIISAEGPHLAMSHTELAQSIIAQLQLEGLITTSECEFRVFTEKRATFACTPDLDRPNNDVPGMALVVAGDYTASDYPATLEGAIRSGNYAAQLLIRKLRTAGAA